MSNQGPDVKSVAEFMPPNYADVITEYKGFIGSVGSPFATRDSAAAQLSPSLGFVSKRMTGVHAFLQDEAAALPDSYETPDDLKQFMQLYALRSVLQGQSFNAVGRLLVAGTAQAKVQGDTESTEIGYATAERLVDLRARFAASELLRASVKWFEDYEDLGLPGEVWSEAVNTNNNRNIHVPWLVSEPEWEEFRELQSEAIAAPMPEGAPFKLGKSRALNVVKVARIGIKMSRGVKAKTIAGTVIKAQTKVLDTLTSTIQQPLEMDSETTDRVSTTVSRTVAYVRQASRINQGIANDPRAQFVFYLNSQLNNINSAVEVMAFERDVDKLAIKAA